ncbi:hypothetical protein RYX36_010092 [Vicia faba]
MSETVVSGGAGFVDQRRRKSEDIQRKKKREKKPSDLNSANSSEQNIKELNDVELSSSNGLDKLLSKEALLRLKESESGLHMKSLDEMITRAFKHLLKSVIASVDNLADLPSAIA